MANTFDAEWQAPFDLVEAAMTTLYNQVFGNAIASAPAIQDSETVQQEWQDLLDKVQALNAQIAGMSSKYAASARFVPAIGLNDAGAVEIRLEMVRVA